MNVPELPTFPPLDIEILRGACPRLLLRSGDAFFLCPEGLVFPSLFGYVLPSFDLKNALMRLSAIIVYLDCGRINVPELILPPPL
jgi:hypothetical protein